MLSSLHSPNLPILLILLRSVGFLILLSLLRTLYLLILLSSLHLLLFIHPAQSAILAWFTHFALYAPSANSTELSPVAWFTSLCLSDFLTLIYLLYIIYHTFFTNKRKATIEG